MTDTFSDYCVLPKRINCLFPKYFVIKHTLPVVDMEISSFLLQLVVILVRFVELYLTRKYPLRGYILGSGAPGTPGVIPMTYGTNFISDIL